MEAFANRVGMFFVEKHIIKQDQQDLFRYGVELLVSALIKETILITVAALLGYLYEMLIFSVSLSALRVYCGGGHAKTFLGCLAVTSSISTLSIATSINLSYYIGKNMILPMVLMIVSIGLIFKYAPKEHPNQPISDHDRIKNTKRARIIVVIDALLVVAAGIAGVRMDWILVFAITVFIASTSTIHKQTKEA